MKVIWLVFHVCLASVRLFAFQDNHPVDHAAMLGDEEDAVDVDDEPTTPPPVVLNLSEAPRRVRGIPRTEAAPRHREFEMADVPSIVRTSRMGRLPLDPMSLSPLFAMTDLVSESASGRFLLTIYQSICSHFRRVGTPVDRLPPEILLRYFYGFILSERAPDSCAAEARGYSNSDDRFGDMGEV